MLRTGLEHTFYEHISRVKSGEDNEWIQLKRMLIKGSVPTPYETVPHSFRLTFSQLLIVFYFSHTFEMNSYSLSFHITTFTLFLSYKNPTNSSFHLILITKIHHLKWCSSLFLELTNTMLREQCETSGWYWLKCKLKVAVYSIINAWNDE